MGCSSSKSAAANSSSLHGRVIDTIVGDCDHDDANKIEPSPKVAESSDSNSVDFSSQDVPSAGMCAEGDKNDDVIEETKVVDSSNGSEGHLNDDGDNESVESVSKQIHELYKGVVDDEDMDYAKVLHLMIHLANVYECKKTMRAAIGAKLHDIGFSETVTKILRRFTDFTNNHKTGSFEYLILVLAIVHNFTDASREFSQGVSDAEIVGIMAENIGKEEYVQRLQDSDQAHSFMEADVSNETIRHVVNSSLGILHNICMYLPDCSSLCEPYNIKQLLKPYLESEDDEINVTATMIITEIITEEENKVLEDTGAIAFMVKILKQALEDVEERRSKGFAPTEIVQCLGRMAQNYRNKLKLVEEGVLPLLLNMLKYTDEEEQTAAARTIWTLSFEKEMHDRIEAEPGLLEALEKLRDSSNVKVQTNVSGIFWTLGRAGNHDNDLERTGDPNSAHAAGKDQGKHIFLSYCHAQREAVSEINTRLKENGYKVWIDKEQMSGNVIEAMADAVENSALVLMCVSSDYKKSPNCRAEAEYTFNLNKPKIPLMLQRYYKPDGWLGLIMGGTLYINFDNKYPFNQAFEKLVKEIQNHLRPKSKVPDEVDGPVTIMKESAYLSHASAPAPHPPKKETGAKWDKQRVDDWLREHDLQKFKKFFASDDGKVMEGLLHVRMVAPEFFHKKITKELKLNMAQLTKISLAFEAIIE